LGWTLRSFNIWVICIVCKMTTIAWFILVFTMRLFGFKNQPIFWSKGKLCWVLLLPHLDANFAIPSHLVLMITKVKFFMLSIDCNSFQN
jgi:hypothetical protein